jgi:hypothetical protein
VDRPRAVFERAAAYVNDVGLLAEEIDPDTGELLGNFPQGVQPHRPRQRGLGDRPGRAAHRVESVTNTNSASGSK